MDLVDRGVNDLCFQVKRLDGFSVMGSTLPRTGINVEARYLVAQPHQLVKSLGQPTNHVGQRDCLLSIPGGPATSSLVRVASFASHLVVEP